MAFLEPLHKIVARFDVSYQYLGKLRTDAVMISGTDWRPKLPDANEIYLKLKELNQIESITDRALSIGFYLMRSQIFKDGNKRIGSFAINKILIANGKGIFNVPVRYDGTFKQILVEYYESNNDNLLKQWTYNYCLDGI